MTRGEVRKGEIYTERLFCIAFTSLDNEAEKLRSSQTTEVFILIFTFYHQLSSSWQQLKNYVLLKSRPVDFISTTPEVCWVSASQPPWNFRFCCLTVTESWLCERYIRNFIVFESFSSIMRKCIWSSIFSSLEWGSQHVTCTGVFGLGKIYVDHLKQPWTKDRCPT